MKRNNLSRIFKLGLLSFAVALIGSSCVKSVSGRTDFDNLQPTVLIPEGGMANYGADAILFPPTDDVDTTWFHVNYAAKDVAAQDLTITIGIDQDALAAYNAQGGAQFAIFPDSIYSFTASAITVKKGDSYSAAIPLVMFPSKIDLLQNYMLPISIKVAPAGSIISSNYKTIYYHLIGNPIAGLYTQEWIRYNTATMTGTPAFDQTFGGVFAPVDGTTINVASGTGVVYVLTFTNTGGVLSDFQVSLDPASIPSTGVSKITITSGPFVVKADPTTGTYEFNFTYLNSSNAARNITDKFSK